MPNKPCQCRSTYCWADDTPGTNSLRSSDNNKNVNI